MGQDMEVVPAALEAPEHLPERAQIHSKGGKYSAYALRKRVT